LIASFRIGDLAKPLASKLRMPMDDFWGENVTIKVSEFNIELLEFVISLSSSLSSSIFLEAPWFRNWLAKH
tara:strand:- start:477 stop:689 length:213 start_codon:yes stop_codon:yes gene_type:complete